MLNVLNRFATKTCITTLFILSLGLLTAQQAAASESTEGKAKESPAASAAADATAPKEAASSECEASAESASLNIRYAAFAAAIAAQPAPETSTTPTTPEAAFSRIMTARANSPAAFAAKPAPRVSTAPMTAGEKFMLFVDRSFRLPGVLAQPIASGLFNELLDNNEGKEDTVGDYFADSMTRAARSYAFRITSNFFERFAFPTIFKQDPRYHRSDKSSVGGKIGYAVSRLFITQGDRGGDQPNISYLAGGLVAAGISNVWVREEHQTVAHTFRRWGIHMGLTAVSNILREFLSGQ